MQAGQDTEPGGPHGDGRITRSPSGGRRRCHAVSMRTAVPLRPGGGPLAGQPGE
jgi:hypothetical protein